MKAVRYILIIFIALLLILLDVSFFSNFTAYGSSFLSSLSILVILAIGGEEKLYYVFMLSAAILLAIFTSLTPILIVTNFIILPSILRRIRTKYFPEPTIISSILYFFLFYLIFELTLLLIVAGYNKDSGFSVLYFVLMNTLMSWLFFLLIKKTSKRSVFPEIKLQ